MYMCLSINVHVLMCMCINSYMFILMCKYLKMCKCINICKSFNVFVYVWLYVCMIILMFKRIKYVYEY